MKRNMRFFIGCLSLILFSAIPCLAKEWHGIVPLHTTRAEIIKMLGNPKHATWDYRDVFVLENEAVTFEWIDPTCARKFPVEPDSEVRPDDLVLNISITPKKPFPISELQIPPDDFALIDCLEGKKGRFVCVHMFDGFSYATSEEGVTGYSYGPTTEEFRTWMQAHGGCQSSH
jgi:hypothetical protein